MIDHDRLFKELLTTFFVEFVELFLPDVSAYLERGSLEFLDKEVFTDITSGERHEADIVVKARFRDREAFFLVHVENQAVAQAEFGRRMFRYFARLHEKHNLPVYPVALFSYDSPERPEPDRYRVEFPGFVVNEFAYRVIQLNRLNWRDFMRQPNPVASALMAKMQIAPEERPRVKLECLRLLAALKLNPARMKLISGFVDTYLRLNAGESQQFDREWRQLSPPEQEATMEIVTSWMEEGLQKGMQRGMQRGLMQGLQQGEANLILRQLGRMLGEVPADTQDRIRSLAPTQLEALGEALLDFRTFADLENWFKDNIP